MFPMVPNPGFHALTIPLIDYGGVHNDMGYKRENVEKIFGSLPLGIGVKNLNFFLCFSL